MNKKLAWGGYILAALMATSAALYKTGVITKAMRQLGIEVKQDSRRIEWLRHMRQQVDSTIPAGATIFLGDSITMGLATSAVAPLSENFGIGGLRSDQLLASMAGYKSLQRAGQVVVGPIGTNDIAQGRDEGLGGRYRAILANIPPQVPVYFNGLPPSTVNSERVRAAGELARSVCDADPRCRFVDLWGAMTVNGAPLPGLLQPDGTHLSPEGYALWVRILREALTVPGSRSDPSPPQRAMPGTRSAG